MKSKRSAPPRRLALPSPSRPLPPTIVRHAPVKVKRRRRNATVKDGGVGGAIVNVLPAIGAGASLAVGAYELSQRASMSPRATAAALTAAGLVGSMVAPKGALQNVAMATVGLGAGFLGLEWWRDRGAHAGASKAAAGQQQARQAGYVTRDEVQDAVRRELGQYHEALAAQISELRNAFSSSDRWDEERNAEPIHTEVFHGEERNAHVWEEDERNAHTWDDDERNAHTWEDDERNAEPIHTEVIHDSDGRNADAWYGEDAA